MNKIASSNLLGKLFGTFQKESQANYDFHWRHSTGLCWQGKAQQVSVNGYVSSLFVVRSTFVFSHYRYLWVPAICRVLFNKLSQIILAGSCIMLVLFQFERVKIMQKVTGNDSLDGFLILLCYSQEMQEDQQKQLKDMKENIGYYQKKAQELEVWKKRDMSVEGFTFLSI